MPYLIDGHNLIPRIPGLNLGDLDVEAKLIRMLQEFARLAQTNLEVYFDKAAAGHSGTRQEGRVKVVFVTSRIIADEQIIKRIRSLGNTVKNWIVVTSDRRIQVEAKAVRAGVMGSDEFARKMLAALELQNNSEVEPPPMSQAELEEWERFFQKKR